MIKFKTPPPTSFLCGHHKCVLPMLYGKDGPSFIKFLKSIYSSHYTIHIHETADIFGVHFFLQILEGYSKLLALRFFDLVSYTIYLLLVSFVAFQSFVDI